jgi:hypothetical protein
MSIRAYVDELRVQTERFAADSPALAFRWRGNDLVFPKAAQDGFDVIVRPHSEGLLVLTDVEIRDEIENDPPEAAREALDLVRQMLSPDMRIRERSAGGQGYGWTLESLHEGRWMPVVQIGVLFWNYFARRSERIYQNRVLPGQVAAERGDKADEGRGGTRVES